MSLWFCLNFRILLLATNIYANKSTLKSIEFIKDWPTMDEDPNSSMTFLKLDITNLYPSIMPTKEINRFLEYVQNNNQQKKLETDPNLKQENLNNL